MIIYLYERNTSWRVHFFLPSRASPIPAAYLYRTVYDGAVKTVRVLGAR